MPYAHALSSPQPAITGNVPALSRDHTIGNQPHGSSSASSSNELPPMGLRVRKMPAQYRDQFPEPPVSTHSPPVPASTTRHVFLHVFDSSRTVTQDILL